MCPDHDEYDGECDACEIRGCVMQSDRELWWTDTSNLAALYEYMRDHDEEPDVVEYLRKPWHFTPEWDRMHTDGDSTDDVEDQIDTDPSELAP